MSARDERGLHGVGAREPLGHARSTRAATVASPLLAPAVRPQVGERLLEASKALAVGLEVVLAGVHELPAPDVLDEVVDAAMSSQ